MNDNTSPRCSSPAVSSERAIANGNSLEESLRSIRDRVWRVLVVAAGYMLASLLAGALLGRPFQLAATGISGLSGILIAFVLGWPAARLHASRLSHWLVWGSVLFFNALSVAIEGAYFAPTLSPMASKPVSWTAYLLFQSLATAGLIAWGFGQNAGRTPSNLPRQRTWYSWAWRFLVSACSYPVFYFIFGAVNYALVTKPYYSAHVSGLAVPAPQTVLMAEIVRAPMIVFSILPLILLWKGRRSLLAAPCGIILFVIGGVVPLLLNTALPDLLRFASGIEIFFQNFLTGVVAVALLGFAATNAPKDQ